MDKIKKIIRGTPSYMYLELWTICHQKSWASLYIVHLPFCYEYIEMETLRIFLTYFDENNIPWYMLQYGCHV